VVLLVLANAMASYAFTLTNKLGFGSNQNKADTSRLMQTLQVIGIRYPTLFTGSKLNFIDSTILQNYQQSSLANLLSSQSQIFIKSYSPGMLATPSFRGGNANHTAVIWNGFNLQNPMNGQIDFSTIPAFLLEHVAIQYGSPAALFGSGNIGGAIHIGTAKPSGKGLQTEFMTGIGSFETYSSGIKLFLTQSKWSMQQKLFWQQSQNDFTYKNVDLLQPQTYPTSSYKSLPTVRAENAQFTTIAWLQEFQFQIYPKLKVGIKSWLQKNERNIPAALNTANIKAKQIDETRKVIIDYQYKTGSYEMQARYGYFNDVINYSDNNNTPSISTSHNQVFFLDNFINKENYQIQGSVMTQNTKANLNTIQTNWFQNRIAVFGTFKWLWFGHKLQQQITLRQEWADGKAVPIIPAYGFNLALGKQFTLFGNIAKSYRLPTFNDLYWPNMGNKELLPEEGWNEELSLKYQISYKKISISSTITAFNKNIQNWIIWVPNGGNLSTPKNIYQVWSRGLEYDWRIKMNTGKIFYSFRGLHDLTVATNEESSIPYDASLNKQIIYTPRVKNMLQFSLQYKSLSFDYTFNYVGTRYVSADHSNWLNPFNYSGLNLGKNLIIKQKNIQCLIGINNIFNQTYQVMVNRPMPLINYQITLNFKL